MSTFQTHGPQLTTGLRREVHGPLSGLVDALRRLRHDAAVGESPATPAILVAGMAIFTWTLAALLITLALTTAALIAG